MPPPNFRIDSNLAYIWTVYLYAIYKSRTFVLILHSDKISIAVQISNILNTIMS